MRCHSYSGQPSGLLFQKTIGAVTTAKWNHTGEGAYLCFARGDENRALGLRKTTLGGVHVHTVGLNAETNGTGIEPKGEIFLLTFLFIGLVR
jgi:hypothetical protein